MGFICCNVRHFTQPSRGNDAAVTAVLRRPRIPCKSGPRANLGKVGTAAVVMITIHVLEIVAAVVVVLLYLLFRLWRRI